MVLVASESVSEPRLTQLAISYYQKEQSNRIFIRTIRDEWSDWRELSSADQFCNPNLLDNWYFGNSINQRNGYIIPAGVGYNDFSWNHAGTTDKAYPVVGYSGRDPLITIDGTNYIVGVAAQVPGYCLGGIYTIDRWMSSTQDKTIKILDDHLSIADAADFGAFLQRFEYRGLLGKTVTFSVLARRTAQGLQKPYITVMIGNNKFEGWGEIVQSDDYQLSSCTVTLSNTAPSEGFFFVDIVGMAGSSIEIKAAKLELGDTQTLAHKENGVWVLNEIPDYGEQLRKCQRYFQVLPAIYWLPNNADGTNRLTIPILDMRTNPVVTYEPADENTGTLYYDTKLVQKNSIQFYAINVTGICGVKNIRLVADL